MKHPICFLMLIWVLASVAVTGCSSISTKNDTFPVTIAKQEMRRLGWSPTIVDRCVYRNDLWYVELHKPRASGGRSDFVVRVSNDGTVVDVYQNLE